eukprot:512700_1
MAQGADSFDYLALYSQLINLGFDEDISFTAAQKFSDITKVNDAMDWIENNKNKAPKKKINKIKKQKKMANKYKIPIQNQIERKQQTQERKIDNFNDFFTPMNNIENDTPNDMNEWKYKKMSKWKNKNVLNWIKCMNLETKWNNKLLNEIKNNQCTGKDIKLLRSGKDVSDSFGILNNKPLCRDIAMKIKNFKPIIKKKKVSNKPFKINIFSQQKHIILDETLTKDATIQYVKVLYKIQSGVVADIDDIQFYYQMKLLPSNKTLEEVNIVDAKHLISVKFKTDGAQ